VAESTPTGTPALPISYFKSSAVSKLMLFANSSADKFDISLITFIRIPIYFNISDTFPPNM